MRRIITNISKRSVYLGAHTIEPLMSVTLQDEEITESMWNQIEALRSGGILKVTSFRDFSVPEIIPEEIVEEVIVSQPEPEVIVEEVVQEVVEEADTEKPTVEEIVVEETPVEEPAPEPKKRTRKTTKSE